MTLFARSACILVTLAAAAGARADIAIKALSPDVSLVTGDTNAKTVQADGKLVLSGWVESTTTAAWTTSLARYTPDGAADPTFDASALQARQIDQLAALPGGKILVVGRFGADPNAGIKAAINDDDADDDDDDDNDEGDVAMAPDPDAIIRLNADGSRDSSFQPGVLTLDWITAVDVLNDGGLLVSGYHTAATQTDAISPFGLVWLTADGAVNASFHGDFAPGVFVDSVKVQSDGRILIVASVGDYSLRSTICRVSADGSPDATFHSGLAADAEIDAVTLLSDGRLLVATSPADDDGDDRGTITRLNGDGSVDPTFAPQSSGSIEQLFTLGNDAVLALGDAAGSDGTLHSEADLIDPSGSVKVLSDPASADWFDSVSPLAGGGFAVGLAVTAADGTQSGAVEIFDASGTLLSRTPLDADLYATSLLPRPAGGVYAFTSANPSDLLAPPPLGATIFSPPPGPGISIKAGPTVQIGVLRSAGYAGATKKAKFLLTRGGDLSKDLKVKYQVRGTAVSGRDYLPLRGEKIIKAGRATAKIKVRPMEGLRYGRVRTGGASVRLVLMERRAYRLGAPSVAKVHLLNHRGTKSQP